VNGEDRVEVMIVERMRGTRGWAPILDEEAIPEHDTTNATLRELSDRLQVRRCDWRGTDWRHERLLPRAAL
jgi:hypothetical protein